MPYTNLLPIADVTCAVVKAPSTVPKTRRLTLRIGQGGQILEIQDPTGRRLTPEAKRPHTRPGAEGADDCCQVVETASNTAENVHQGGSYATRQGGPYNGPNLPRCLHFEAGTTWWSARVRPYMSRNGVRPGPFIFETSGGILPNGEVTIETVITGVDGAKVSRLAAPIVVFRRMLRYVSIDNGDTWLDGRKYLWGRSELRQTRGTRLLVAEQPNPKRALRFESLGGDGPVERLRYGTMAGNAGIERDGVIAAFADNVTPEQSSYAVVWGIAYGALSWITEISE
ncbi:MAG: hypothetical protein OES46_19840 [Gammaproteobacteria bacterium]|nr:hypothetical protein [Gammaproteobacteria bacterium]